jgi:hypothetical protein
MPIEPPDPHGKLLAELRDVLAQLQAAACEAPGDPTLLPAIGHVGAAVAILAIPDPRERGVADA